MPSRRLLSARQRTRSRTDARTAGSSSSAGVFGTGGSGLVMSHRQRSIDVEHLDHAVARHHPHVEPLLLIISLEGVDLRQVIVGSVQVTDVAEGLAAALPGEYLVD